VASLHVVGTPIGNLEDLTDRARRVLGSVDVVVAEDTRRTGRLLAALGVRARLLSMFEGNETTRVPEVVELLRDGAEVAVVTDAGMPGISDPGFRLVAACVEAGINVDVVPGPSAAIAALVVSGLPTDRFVMEGFLPRSGAARAERIAAVVEERRTVVLFESPRRVARTLVDLARAGAGDRRVAVARELTKLHEEVVRGTVADVARRLGERALKGEVAVVIEGAPEPKAELESAVAMAAALEGEGVRRREAARRAARAAGVGAREVYAALVEASGSTRQGTAGSRPSAAGRRATSSE
jgi:16S rRNA (cytidine1402-2'-O)-methyltransferase